MSRTRARRCGDSSGRALRAEFTAEVSFYLALALQRAGRAAEARTEFGVLCAAKGEFQTRACDAARAMMRSPPR